MFNPSREQARRFLVESWRKRRDRLPATPLETMAGDIVALHPEYHALLDSPDKAVDKDWSPESGETNPFLHLSLHLAIAEQLSVDQPPGIAAVFNRLLASCNDHHEALHTVLDCLAETLWRSQRNQTSLDSAVYLELLQDAANRG